MTTESWRPPPRERESHDVGLAGYRDFTPVAGGSGSRVYRAWQEALDRPVAVKVLDLDDPEALARFEREIDITVQLGRRHPNIMTVLDIGATSDGRPCIVMEFCDGGSLHDRLRAHGPLRVDDVLEAGFVVADALSFAHGQGVLHRDVKPQNIMVLPTSYVLADFGIARRADATQHTSSVDWFTFQHASPQVIDGEPPTESDDIWSVGSTLFSLLDGRPPFARQSPEENKPLAYMRRVRTQPPRELTRNDVPAALVDVIAGCLRPRREDRIASAAELRDALLLVRARERSWAPPRVDQATARRPQPPMSPDALAHLVSSAASASAPVPDKPVLKSRRWGRWIAAGVAVLALASFAGVTAILLSHRPASPSASPSASPNPSAAPNLNDPAIAPVIETVQVAGGGVRLRWQDPTQGKATFVVVRVEGERGEPLATVPAGRTETTVDSVAGKSLCFLIIAVLEDKRGVSRQKCA